MNLELFLILLIAIAIAAWLIVRQQNFRLRQMQHRERLAALEEGLPATRERNHEGDQDMSNAAEQWKDPSTYVTWIRFSTLGLAFLLMFGGVGMLVSFIIVEDPEMRKLWSLGLIPIMTGFGLFLFWALTTAMLRKKDD